MVIPREAFFSSEETLVYWISFLGYSGRLVVVAVVVVVVVVEVRYHH